MCKAAALNEQTEIVQQCDDGVGWAKGATIAHIRAVPVQKRIIQNNDVVGMTVAYDERRETDKCEIAE